MERVSREEIKDRLMKLFSVVSNMDNSTIKETSSLKDDLLLSSSLISALAHSYTQISESYGGKKITIATASDLETVGDAIDLVHERVNT